MFFTEESNRCKEEFDKRKDDKLAGQMELESILEAMRDCKVICRRIELISEKFSKENDVPAEIYDDLEYMMSHVKRDKLEKIDSDEE